MGLITAHLEDQDCDHGSIVDCDLDNEGPKYPASEIMRLHDRTQVNLTQPNIAPLLDHSRVFDRC